jgi:Mg-chelatase subunit ChlD
MKYRFRIKALPPDDQKAWIRIPKIGRAKLGKKQGDTLSIDGDKFAIKLTVHQGLKEDANNMVVRMAPSVIHQLGYVEGDIIELGKSSSRKTEICILAIDCSLSMGDNGKINKVISAVGDFLDEKTKIRKDGDLVGCIGFAGEAWVIFNPSTAYKTKLGGLNMPELKLGTDLIKPLDLARSIIAGGKKAKEKLKNKSSVHKHVILLADGNSEHNPSEAAQRCKAAGIVVDTVGVIDKANSQHQLGNLEAIARITGGRYVGIDQADLHRLRGLFQEAAKDKSMAQ